MAPPKEWASENPIIEIAKPLEGYMSDEEWHREWKKLMDIWYTALVTNVFKLIGLDPKDHVSCFHASVAKCKSTNVLTAETWSGWGGYEDVKEKMRYIARRTEATGRYHILNATSVVAAIAIKSMRRINTTGNDEVTLSLIKYKTFHFAAESVKSYTKTNTPIIQTNQPYPRPTPPSDIVTTVTHTMNRMRAVEVVEPLVERIQQELWQADLNNELEPKLTEETVAVLPPTTKSWLAIWARQSGKPIILERLEMFAEDKVTHEWTETRRLQGPMMWSSTSPALTLLDDLLHLVEHADLNKEMARRKMKALIASLRHYFLKMEEMYELKAKADTLDAIKALQDAIVAMKEEMQKLQKSIQNCVAKRTHDEAFGNPGSN
ncbi:hypothetical protein GGI43DRAFT_380886 [Trichoderma evansii]